MRRRSFLALAALLPVTRWLVPTAQRRTEVTLGDDVTDGDTLTLRSPDGVRVEYRVNGRGPWRPMQGRWPDYIVVPDTWPR